VRTAPALAQPFSPFATPAVGRKSKERMRHEAGSEQRALVANSEQYGSAGLTRT
jgi:hypothetical protein